MSRLRVFFLCIFLVFSTFTYKVEPFEENNGVRSTSFLETEAQGNPGQGIEENNSPGGTTTDDQIANTRPLQENITDTSNNSEQNREHVVEESATPKGEHDDKGETKEETGKGEIGSTDVSGGSSVHASSKNSQGEAGNEVSSPKEGDSTTEGGDSHDEHVDKTKHEQGGDVNKVEQGGGNYSEENLDGYSTSSGGRLNPHNLNEMNSSTEHATNDNSVQHEGNISPSKDTSLEPSAPPMEEVLPADEKMGENNATVPVSSEQQIVPFNGSDSIPRITEVEDNGKDVKWVESNAPEGKGKEEEDEHLHEKKSNEEGSSDRNGDEGNNGSGEINGGEHKKGHGVVEEEEENSNSITSGLHDDFEPMGFDLFKGKGIHISLRERIILEIMESAKEGINGLHKLKNSKDSGKLYEEVLERLKINSREISTNRNLLSLDMYDKILSTMFKILTEMSFYEEPKFYESLNINKSILNESLKEIKIKMLRKIGVSYVKLPPIIKKKKEDCMVKDFVISITSKELSQRMAIMFTKWLSNEEYGSVVDIPKSIEINTLCAGAPILIQQWKYYQNHLGFEIDNEHAFLNLIDELLVLDKRFSNNNDYSKILKKIKKSKVFNYCTKLMRIAGNIASVPFNHENVKKPSSSIIGSLGNLVKAHISTYYIAIAKRINSYFFYSERRSKKSSSLKVISVCTLLHITDILYNCSNEHKHNILDLHNLKMNALNMEGKKVLNPLVHLSYLSEERNLSLKEMCQPKNNLVAETLSKLLIVLSTDAHELLAAELDKRGLDEDYIQEEIKNINDSDHDVRDEGEDEVEKMIFDDL
ncbi:rhoptry neck protein 4, putative [Plasmodium ovale]|uniref:Rhoptry neck protein 4 n=2 Tax=Plasmodium ovale TaxID=36330 RepID=A0A1A8WG71_PLAOA|nr:rhoptry neck protein 4 [Plasmodium ovale curtisi]SCP04487.1 rhoptry neck protein 4, putative [Plasmodium ovale]